jgi:hypothetical protein
MLAQDRRREQKAERKANESPASKLEAKAKFIITRHRALYANMSELKEFESFKI